MRSTMEYKNIVFDFGNVIARFDPEYLLSRHCKDQNDFPLLMDALFQNWQALDEGEMMPEEALELALNSVPDRLHDTVRAFFLDWYLHLIPMEQTWALIHELKERGYGLYLLSNAPVDFAAHADHYSITEAFDGIVFSAVIRMAKPHADIYHYLYEKYQLDPKECFFLDDKPVNIQGAKDTGMDGMVFTGDVEAVKREIGF